MLRAHFAASIAATVTLMLSACGGSAPDAGAPGSPAGPIGTDTDLAALCDRACDNAAEGACDNFNPDCAADCKAALDDFPVPCKAEVKAVFSCYAEQTAVCNGEQVPGFPQCTQALIALGACVQAQGEPDPSDGDGART